MTEEILRHVEIDKIVVNPFQPRRHFESADLTELANSIANVGIIHPPLVRISGENYELISGERRYRAAKLAGLTHLPVIINDHNDQLSAQAALIENIQRVDLNPIEIAKALKSLAEQCHLNQEELSNRIGKKRSTVANYLRLLTLPQEIQDNVYKGVISMGHAKAILALGNSEQQHALNQLVIDKQLTVRETEEAVQTMIKKDYEPQGFNLPAPNPPPVQQEQDCHLAAITSQLQEKLGTKVTIQGKGVQGTISIEYYNLDDLDRILSLFQISDSELF